MLRLFVDTDSDVTLKLAKEYGANLISMPYYVNGKEVKPYVDFEEFDAKPFYDMERKGIIPQTNALNPEDYKIYFEPIFAAGDDILYAHFSEAMSGTFNSMRLALEELKEKYPDRKFYEIDTKGMTVGSYCIVRQIMEMYKNGATAEEMLAWADENVLHYATYFFADDLKFFARSGRVSNFTSIMGGILSIKPVLYMSAEGKLVSISKGKGHRGVLNKIMSYIKELGDHVAEHPIYIAHSDCIDLVNEVVELLKAEYGENLNIEIIYVNPTAGAHCGPDSLGVSFHAIHR